MKGCKNNADGSFYRKLHNHDDGVELPSEGRQQVIRRTEADEIDEHIYKMVLNFVRPLDRYLRLGYRHRVGEFSTPKNEAMAHIYKHALFRDGYNSIVNPLSVKISFGRLAFQNNFRMCFDRSTSELVVTWHTALPLPQPGEKAGTADDRLMLVAYDPWGKGEAFGRPYGARRREGMEKLKIPVFFPTINYYVYAAFVSADDTDQATSCCIGELEVAHGQCWTTGTSKPGGRQLT